MVLVCFCELASRIVSTMVYGKKKLGRLVKKYTQVEPSLKRGASSSRGSGSSRCSSDCDCDSWDSSMECDAPAGVPAGCLAVYVGPQMQRFVIPARFLCNQVFRELLRRSEEEYGFETEGGLRIPCEAAVFERLLWELESE